MTRSFFDRLRRPETLTAMGLIAGSAALLTLTPELPALSALLPIAMLLSLMVLAGVLLVKDQLSASRGQTAKPMTESPHRVLGALIGIVVYMVCVEYLGFYLSTAVSVPALAYAFGYRNGPGLVLATLIVVGSIYGIFDWVMGQSFPIGQLWAA